MQNCMRQFETCEGKFERHNKKVKLSCKGDGKEINTRLSFDVSPQNNVQFWS